MVAVGSDGMCTSLWSIRLAVMSLLQKLPAHLLLLPLSGRFIEQDRSYLGQEKESNNAREGSCIVLTDLGPFSLAFHVTSRI